MTDYGRDIEKYLKGELTPTERYALERKALHDPFLADALEGAEQIKAADFLKDVTAINEKVAGKKVVSVWMWPARIAAGLLIVALSTFIIWSVIETEPVQDLALQKNEPAVTPPTAKDSATVTGALSSGEQPIAGPTKKDTDVATRSAAPSKVKPQQAAAEEPKNESIADALIIIAEAEETKAAQSVAEIKPTEKEVEVARTKVEDDRERQLANKGGDKKKEAPAGKQDAAPVATERRDAGVAASSIASNIIRGQVTSAEDGAPLRGVNVVIKNSTIGTATNAQGNYQIETSEPNRTLVYVFIGMKSTEVEVKDKKEVNIQMTPDATQLSEVIVTGYGKSNGEPISLTVDLAHAESGNRAFKQYLEKNLRYPNEAKSKKIEGRVTVEFTVESDGTLSDFTIIRGIGYGCDEELIRLIKEGPKWAPTKYNYVPVQDKAKVRLKFELPK